MFSSLVVLLSLIASPAYSALESVNVLNGESFSLPRVPTQGRAHVVVFLSSKCPCSRDHESKLSSLAKDFSEFPFYGVVANGDETFEQIKMHFQKSQLGFPVLHDQGSQIVKHFGALKTPHAFVVAKNGEVLYQGGVDDSKRVSRSSKQYLKDALDQIREGKRPSVAVARTLGCYIKRGN